MLAFLQGGPRGMRAREFKLKALRSVAPIGTRAGTGVLKNGITRPAGGPSAAARR